MQLFHVKILCIVDNFFFFFTKIVGLSKYSSAEGADQSDSTTFAQSSCFKTFAFAFGGAEFIHFNLPT